MPSYTASDPTASINTKAGKTFSIVLDSNPTTGYSWQISSPLDRNLLKLTGAAFKTSSNRCGAPGKEVWTFKAIRKGSATIKMHYARSWEKNVPPAIVNLYKVTID